MRFGRVACAGALAVATLVTGVRIAGAEPGDVDSTYGECGVKEWKWDGSLGFPGTTATQADGKILRFGYQYDQAITVTRQSASGAGIDRAYGTNGTGRIATPGVQYVTGGSVAPNGKLVVVGERRVAGAQTGLVLARFTAAGRPDATFGNGGVVTSDTSGGVSGAVVQADNRVVIWGSWPLPFLRRYLNNGTVDTTWAPPIPSGVSSVNVGVLEPDGDLIVGGGLGVNTNLYRYKPNGTADGTFAASFVFPGTNPATNSGFTPTKILRLVSGKLLVLGHLAISNPTLGTRYFVGAVQLTSTGAVDTTFGTAGFLSTPTSTYSFRGTTGVDAEDRLLVVTGSEEDGFYGYLNVTRFTTAGVPDATFGIVGTGTAEIDGYGIPAGISVRGNWIIVDVATYNYPNNMATVRFRTDTTKLGAGYQVDPDGNLHPFRFGTDPPPPCIESPELRGLARGVTTITNRGGLILDGHGGLHPFAAGARKAPAAAHAGPYWPSLDIARGVAALRNGKGGYVLDGYGGIHSYLTGTNPRPGAATGGPYWPGWDIARGIALMPNGPGGYVLDGFGTLHPFRVGGSPLPPATTTSFFLPGVDIARGVAILPDGTGGYVTDAFGTLHPFGIGGHAAPPLPGPTAPNGQTGNSRGVTFVAPRIGP